MANEHKLLSRDEALEALKNGKRVQFHWQGKVTEIDTETTLDDLRWNLMGRLSLLVSDVTSNNYSIIS